MKEKKFRLALVVSHPIQHFCPQYASFAKLDHFEFKVFFASMQGVKKYVDKNFGKEVQWSNIDLTKFNHVFLNGDKVLPSTKELVAPELNKELEKFNPDGIITYGYFQKFQRDCHKWANKNKVPLAYITDAENRQKRPGWKRLAKYFYLRWYFKKIDYFFTVGNANEDYYQLYGVPERKLIRMHYPIDVPIYKNAFDNKELLRKNIRKEFNIPEDEFVICVVGKLVVWKNQDHLIDLLHSLEKKGKKAHVLIIGSGPQEESIKEKAKKLRINIAHSVGFVSPLDLPKYYAASDLYLHPAMIEPHSLAISEAIAMGLPVILSDRCGSYGPTDDVQIGKNGEVYSFGDITGMANAVEKIMNNSQLRLDYGAYSKEISQKFQQRSHLLCVKELKDKIWSL